MGKQKTSLQDWTDKKKKICTLPLWSTWWHCLAASYLMTHPVLIHKTFHLAEETWQRLVPFHTLSAQILLWVVFLRWLFPFPGSLCFVISRPLTISLHLATKKYPSLRYVVTELSNKSKHIQKNKLAKSGAKNSRKFFILCNVNCVCAGPGICEWGPIPSNAAWATLMMVNKVLKIKRKTQWVALSKL